MISVVVPVKNEAASLVELADRICDALKAKCGHHACEILFVDDGSSDASWHTIMAICNRWPGVVYGIRFRRNMGKALALEAGFRACRGDIIFTMDADLQDDPAEIPKFLEKLDSGFDLVSGWKRTRHDPLSKTLPSKIFNSVTAKLTGVKLNDFNCGFKCYRREVVDQIQIYGELHRYIPVLAAELGYRVGEVEVVHHPRAHGVSNYGWERYLRGLIDLLTVLATTRWLAKPGHLFGGIGVLLGLIGGASLGYLFVIWLCGGQAIGGRPLLMFGVLTSVASLQMLSLGVIAEFFVKSMPLDVNRYIATRISPDGVHLKRHDGDVNEG